MRRRRYDDRLSVTHPGRLVDHHRRRAVEHSARGTHPRTAIIIGNCDTHQGAKEATYDGTVLPTHRITQYSTGTRAKKRAGQLIGSHGVVAESGQTGHQQDRGYKFGFHDSLHRLSTVPD